MEPGSDLDPERTDAVADGAGAANRPRWSIERRQEAVPHRLDLSASMPFEFPPYDAVVRVEDRAPRTIAQRRGALGRADDGGEEHSGEHAGDLRNRPAPREEPPELPEHRLGVAHSDDAVPARELHLL